MSKENELLKRYFKECIDDCRTLGIKPGKISSVTINSRAQKRWGYCKYNAASKTYDIQVSSRLLTGDVEEYAVKNTIMHEILHTCKNCMKHTGEWKQLATMINIRMPQYHIVRVTSSEEKGIESVETVKKINSSTKYIVECKKCGHRYIRLKMSKLIQHPEHYRCGKCSGMLRRVV